MYENQDILNKKLNTLLEWVSVWKKDFDETPDIHFSFATNCYDMLTVNGIVLCPLSSVNTEKVRGNIHGISIPTTSGDLYTIVIDWPFDAENPSISVITKSNIIYQALGQEY